ncbi:MAG: glycosyltransferase [Eubacteriales bacterium]|nr:glycosyltransferase [Eubacteriales bacterium]
MCRLSIVVPVYNIEPYLAKCLDSLISENASGYEIIVVNDGSTDGSGAIAEAYRARFPSLITVISTENHGLGAARNLGLERASGEYVLFVDSDDYLAPGAVEEILAHLEDGFDLCIFDSVSVAPDGRELDYVRGCKREGSLRLSEYPGLLLEIPNAWNKIYRRSFFLEQDIRFPSRVWFEDLRTVLKLYYFADRIDYVPRAWYRYLIRPGSITNTKNAARNLEIIDAVDDVLGFFRSKGCYGKYRDELEYLAFHSQFLTSSVRANLADWKSPVQEELMQDFLNKFPDFRENPYVRASSKGHKLLSFLLLHRMRLSVHVIMKLNNLIKRGKA